MKRVNIANNDLMALIKLEITNKDISLLVKGSSMLPFYKNNKTTVVLTKKSDLKKFDVILFKYNNKYILHRIINIKENTIITRGDGLISKEITNSNNVIAVVKQHQTNNKTINANSKRYLFRVKLWNLLRPARRLLLKFVRR